MLAVLAIGDCELLILRRCQGYRSTLQAVFHTEMQRIEGNAQAPLQIARVDDRVDANFDERISIDVIERGSAVHCMSAYEGDILVQGSDGLFDNLFLDEIMDICNEYLPPRRGHQFAPTNPDILEEIARRIVAECHNKTKPGEYGQPRDCPIGKGGKVDDTCCVVGEVIEWTELHSQVWTRPRKMDAQNSIKSFFYNLSSGLFRCNGSEEDDGSEYDSGSEFGSEVEPGDCGAKSMFGCKASMPSSHARAPRPYVR